MFSALPDRAPRKLWCFSKKASWYIVKSACRVWKCASTPRFTCSPSAVFFTVTNWTICSWFNRAGLNATTFHIDTDAVMLSHYNVKLTWSLWSVVTVANDPGMNVTSAAVWTVSERPCTAVPVGLLRSGRWCRHSAAPAFRQTSTTCSTSLPAQHLRPSGLFSCWSHSLELSTDNRAL